MNSYYEKIIATGEVKCIDEEIPFEIPNGWEWERVGNIFFVTKLAGFEYTKFFTKEAISAFNPIPIVRAQNVRMGFFEENKNEAISEMLSNQLKRSALNKKCLLMTFIGAGIGDTCIFPAERKNHLAPNVAKIEPLDDSIFLDYAVFALMSPCGQRGVNAIKKSTAQPSLSMETIRKLLIPIPPFKEQKCISLKLSEVLPLVEKYSKVQKVQNQINDEINILLSKSILQEAIRGKLVPQIAEEGTADKLLAEIHKEKERLVKEGKLKKAILTDSVIYKGDDNKYYEQIGSKVVDITGDIPFEIPPTWMWCRFGTIVKMRIGKTPPRGEQVYWSNGKHNWVSISDMVEGGTIKAVKEKVSDIAVNEIFKCYPTPKGSLLMSFKLTVGRTSILGVDAYHNEAIITIVPYADVNNIFRDYLFYILPTISNSGDSKDAIKGKTLNNKSLNNLLIPLPPLLEQKRIVTKIELVNSKIKG